MPVYEYRCQRGHLFDVTQRMTEDPLTACTQCEAPVQRVFHPVAVHFKGSGFYATDYGRAGSSGNSDKADKGSESSGGEGPSGSDASGGDGQKSKDGADKAGTAASSSNSSSGGGGSE